MANIIFAGRPGAHESYTGTQWARKKENTEQLHLIKLPLAAMPGGFPFAILCSLAFLAGPSTWELTIILSRTGDDVRRLDVFSPMPALTILIARVLQSTPRVDSARVYKHNPGNETTAESDRHVGLRQAAKFGSLHRKHLLPLLCTGSWAATSLNFC